MISKTILNRSGESRHSCLIADFSRNGFICSPFSIMLTLGLSYIALIILRNSSQIPDEFFQKIYWEDHVVFILASVYMLYYIYRFMYIEPFLHPCNETNLIMVYDLFDVLLNYVWQYFVENLWVYISWRYWSIILLFGCIFIGFGMNVMLASQNEFGIVPYLSISWKGQENWC
jgi:hypothetical protein